MICLNLKLLNLFIVPLTTKLQIHFAINLFLQKIATVQVELQGRRLIATIYTFLVTKQITYC